MNFIMEDGANSFCKTLHNNSAKYLSLPSTFAEKHLGEDNINNPLLVVDTKSAAVKWSVEYIKVEDKYYFMDGWLPFVNDNHLQAEDNLFFLLLSPPPDPMFQVFVYAPDGSLKRPGPDGSLKRRGSDIDGSLLKCPSSDEHTPPEDKKPSVVEIVSDDDQESSEKMPGRSLMRVIKKWHKGRLPMTKAFVNANGLNGYNKLKLKNNNGKIWEVGLSKHRGGKGQVDIPFITSGLHGFMRDNKMKVGDSCEFNHVNGNLLHFRVIKKKN